MRTLVPVLLATAGGVSAPTVAQAQFWFEDAPRRVYRAPARNSEPRRTRHDDAVSAKKSTKEPIAVAAGVPPLFAVVSIEDQHVSIYGANGLIERAQVSTGTAANPTPTGVFAIIQKERWHESNIYSGAPMPFMQRITWSGVAMHQGQLPGYPASHGCIRLSGEFAERWFGMTKTGLRVLISPTDIEPVAITHPLLPVPRTWTVPGEHAPREPVQSAGLGNDQMAALAGPVDIELNPISYAIAAKARAKFDLKQSEKAEGDASEATQAATKAVKSATAELRLAERAQAIAQDRLAWFGLVGNRPPPSPKADFGEGLMVALANYQQANTRLADARRAEAAARQAITDAAEAERVADANTESLKARITEMTRRQETASVLISRKDGRLYLRQALRPVFEVPIAIRDPERPIGTHVYMALPPLAGDKTVRWQAMSMPVEVQPLPRSSRQKKNADVELVSGLQSILTESAATALDRIELSGEVREKLSEYIWAGGSIIVSDHGITHETGTGTDFIVQTKH